MSVDVPEALAAVPSQLYIGGEWVDAADHETFASTNPATGEVITLQSRTVRSKDAEARSLPSGENARASERYAEPASLALFDARSLARRSDPRQ